MDRQAFEHAHIGMALVAPDGRWLKVNRSLCRIVGYSEQELLTKSFQDITHPDDLDADLELAQQVLDGEIETYQLEKRYVRADQTVVWIMLSVTLVRGEDGAPLYFVSQIEDIDERKRGAEALEESERRFRALTTQAPVGIFETDADGACLFVNDRWSELTGMALSKALGTGWAQALHAEDRERVFTQWTEATSAGREFELEHRFQRPDGSTVLVIGHAVALRDEAGAVRGYLGTCLDITERRRTEAARREAEQRFTAAFESAAVGMAITGIGPGNAGRFLKVNHALCQMTGYPEMDLLGRTSAEITHPDHVDQNLSEFGRLVAGEIDRVELEKRYVRADGTPLWVQVNAALVRDADGRPLHTVAQILDINGRKELEERLRYLAGHDQMTGLFNRYSFEQELERQLAYSRRYRLEGVLILADLDRFKDVNDSLGHHAGDELLRVVATTIRGALRESDILGRLGGDEFVVFLPHTDLAGGEKVVRTIVDWIRAQTVSLGGYEVQTTASAGVALYDPRTEMGAGTLLIRADRAMYRAKDSGGDCYAVFSDTLPQVAPRWKSADAA